MARRRTSGQIRRPLGGAAARPAARTDAAQPAARSDAARPAARSDAARPAAGHLAGTCRQIIVSPERMVQAVCVSVLWQARSPAASKVPSG